MIKVALLNLTRRKTRTFLAVFGIALGIASLTILISLVDGLYADASQTIGKMQGVFVFNKSVPDPSMGKIDYSYINKIKTIPGVKEVIPEVYHMIGKINNKSIEINMTNPTFIYGIDPKNIDKCSYSTMIEKITKGRKLKQNDKKAIMVSENFADKYNLNIGQSINIDGKKFKVVGIFKIEYEMMNPIIAKIDEVKELYNYEKNKINAFYVVPINKTKSSQIAKAIEFKIDKVQAQGQQEMQEQLGKVLNNLKLLSIIVSIVAAIVAGIGVINTMLMSVMERTKEIGTLKAIGWTRENVIVMILLESMFIGIFGSLLGLIIGYIGSSLLSLSFNLTTIISFSLIIKNFLFGLFLGVIGGIYPAYIASKLDPIQALRNF